MPLYKTKSVKFARKPRGSRKIVSRKKYARKASNRRFWGGQRPIPLSNKSKITMRYVEKNISLNPSAGIAAEYVFSANGIYDPNITGGGHQTLGFDQFMQMYDHYTVIGAKIRVQAASIEPNYPVTLGLYLSDSATTSADFGNVAENGMMKYVTLGPAGGGSNCKTLVHQVSISKFFGRKIMQDSTMRGTQFANPADQVYFHIIAEGLSSVPDPTPIDLLVQIDYIVILTEPKKLASS